MDFFNKLFDSINAQKIKSDAPLRIAVTRNSFHHSFWYDAINQLQNIKFIDKKNKKPVSTPSLNNWITTIKGFQKLWTTVNKAGIKCLKTRNINQDPLENFFGMIRNHNRRNINSTCSNFESSFKTLLINNFTGRYSVSSNCEEDVNGKALLSLQHFVENSIQTENTYIISNTYIIEEIADVNNNIDNNISMSPKDNELINSELTHHNDIGAKLFCMEPFNSCDICKENISTQEIEAILYRAYIICKNAMPSESFRIHVNKKFKYYY